MPNTIAQNLARLVAAKTAIADAITAKGGTVGANDGLEDFSTDIGTIPSGGSIEVPKKAVNFYDYDGTIVNSYTATEFAQLSELPVNPTHTGLTAQGWNWDLADAKTYVANYGALDIGQTYITDNGATRLYITLTEGRLSPTLGLCPKGTLTIDWGDGSPTETMTGSSESTVVYLTHNYVNTGDYIVSIFPSTGSSFGIGKRNSLSTIFCSSSSDNANRRYVYLNILKSVELGNGITQINTNAFNGCRSLVRITLCNNITILDSNSFQSCKFLIIIIPSSVSTLGSASFQDCSSVTNILIPNTIKSLKSTFYYCTHLFSIIIPSSVTGFSADIFSSCISLASVLIPNSVTSLGYGFKGCNTLTSVTVPNNVSSIASETFANCYGLGFIKFISQIPPAIVSSSAFSSLSTDCIIYAPALVVNLYMDGTNYPAKATYTYIGFATYTIGDTLPDKTTDETYTLTWYATVNDAKAGTNPITVGNGNEVYAIATIIS